MKTSLAALFGVALSWILAAATPIHAHAGPVTAKEAVSAIIDHAKQLDDKANRAENARVIEALVDFRALARDSIGNHARQATEKQQAEISELLRKIITRTVYPEAPKFFKDVTIQYTAEDTQDAKTHITSVVTKGQKRSTVEYWLVATSGCFRVVDLAIEGERWVENVNEQFDELIRKRGVGGLIEKMKKRLRELESAKT